MTINKEDMKVVRTMSIENTSSDLWAINLTWSKTEEGKIATCPVLSGTLHFYAKGHTLEEVIEQMKMTVISESLHLIHNPIVELIQQPKQGFFQMDLLDSIEQIRLMQFRMIAADQHWHVQFNEAVKLNEIASIDKVAQYGDMCVISTLEVPNYHIVSIVTDGYSKFIFNGTSQEVCEFINSRMAENTVS
ncbi:hypothetical protein PaeCFBP13512_22075 [Paenibacillus sp. CFBP13512]|uniref:hypothetical protein n=1 Tax=Paenibacillus sp. CFBP13512 TaxID=2184007 RepID=UPI0010BFC06C|nr:hypothetical protein [Paenibacillus sp. CFBP13512]TKJ83810.1 hypothetical protein PaeCFBP13512_22075 [Paenibacillus sp. CFBP13512]